MPKDIIVIGASAGGVEALKILMRGLPADLAAAVFVVVHIAPDSPGFLHQILNRAGALKAVSALDKQRIERGKVYVARPDFHMLLEPGFVRVTRGPRENRFRPAVDPLFRSAAQTYGPRTVGVILTGGLDDGTAGLWAIKSLGGTSIVQDPDDAQFDSMPRNALMHVQVDYCLPLEAIASQLVRLTEEVVEEKGAYTVPEGMEIEVNIAKENSAQEAGIRKLGEPSIFTCPECHGVLLQLSEGDRIRYRCHTGHAYSVDSLLSDLTEKIGESLWNSVRSIQEAVMLMRHIAKHLGESQDLNTVELLLRKADEAERRGNAVRETAMDHEQLSTEKVVDGASSSSP
jgi:two-component system chemotaxis response regulator CheB